MFLSVKDDAVKTPPISCSIFTAFLLLFVCFHAVQHLDKARIKVVDDLAVPDV